MRTLPVPASGSIFSMTIAFLPMSSKALVSMCFLLSFLTSGRVSANKMQDITTKITHCAKGESTKRLRIKVIKAEAENHIEISAIEVETSKTRNRTKAIAHMYNIYTPPKKYSVPT